MYKLNEPTHKSTDRKVRLSSVCIQQYQFDYTCTADKFGSFTIELGTKEDCKLLYTSTFR